MKKTYISPEMDVIVLQNQQTLLAGSVQMPKSDTEIDNAGDILAPEYTGF